MPRGESETELISITTSGVFADSEDGGGTVTPTREIELRRMSTVDEDSLRTVRNQMPSQQN